MSERRNATYAKKIKLVEGSTWLVPCFANSERNFFQPLRQLGSSSSTPNTEDWTSLEDKILERIIKQRESLCWADIAKEFNLIVFKREDVRTPKQCRERWINHVDLDRSQWTVEEDIFILVFQREVIEE